METGNFAMLHSSGVHISVSPGAVHRDNSACGAALCLKLTPHGEEARKRRLEP